MLDELTIFAVGFPAPCPAFVSILIRNGFSFDIRNFNLHVAFFLSVF
jgi:hypothetical protein